MNSVEVTSSEPAVVWAQCCFIDYKDYTITFAASTVLNMSCASLMITASLATPLQYTLHARPETAHFVAINFKLQLKGLPAAATFEGSTIKTQIRIKLWAKNRIVVPNRDAVLLRSRTTISFTSGASPAHFAEIERIDKRSPSPLSEP